MQDTPLFGSAPMEPRDLAKKLVAEVQNHNDGDTWLHGENRQWTEAVKKGLENIARELPVKTTCVYTAFAPGAREFLLDVVWWNKEDSEGASLACECEWYWSRSRKVEDYHIHVGEDFEKLLVFKAPLKLMIFATPKNAPWVEEPVIEKINGYLLGYKHHVLGEKYLVLDFAPKPKCWMVEVSGNGASRPQLKELQI